MNSKLDTLIKEQQKIMSTLEGILDNDQSSIDVTLEMAVDCTISSARLVQVLIPLKEESTSREQMSDVDGGEFQEFVDIFDASKLVRKALEIRDDVWNDLSNDDRELLIISAINDARFKRLHELLSAECKKTNREVSSDMLNLLNWYIALLNLGRTENQKINLEYPKIGSFYDRDTMDSVVETISGKVKEVLLPGVNGLKLKALVIAQ
jgi:hypothetical protein